MEGTRGDQQASGIDWRMSAALECVPRGDTELAEVTSLENAVRAWRDLDVEHRLLAVLTPERAVQIDGVNHVSFTGEAIAWLAGRLPDRSASPDGPA